MPHELLLEQSNYSFQGPPTHATTLEEAQLLMNCHPLASPASAATTAPSSSPGGGGGGGGGAKEEQEYDMKEAEEEEG